MQVDVPSSARAAPAIVRRVLGEEWRRNGLLVLVLAVVHLCLALLVLRWHAQPSFAVFWPSAGLAAGAMIAFGGVARIALATSTVLAVALANIMVGRPPEAAVVFGIGDTVEALIVSSLALRLMPSRGEIGQLRDLGGFFVAAAAGTMIGAILAATMFKLLLGAPDGLLDMSERWFEATFIGVCTFAPLVMMAPTLVRERLSLAGAAEGVLLLMVLALVAVYFYGGFLPEAGYLRYFTSGATFLIPLMLWIAARATPAFAGAAVSVVALVIVYCTTNGLGRLGDASVPLDDRTGAARIAMLTFAIVALGIATLFAERRRAEGGLRQANDELCALSASLESRIAERTRDLSVANRELTHQAIERERVTAELRQSEAWLRAAQRTAGIGSFALGPCASPDQHWSDEARRIIGRPISAMTLDGFVETVVHQADRRRVRTALEAARAASTAASIEYRIVRPDGNVRTLLTAVEPGAGSGGDATLLCTALDVTERNAAEQKVAEYRAELLHVVRVATAGELATIMAHEVNQPLTAISHTASALVRLEAAGRLPPGELREHLMELSAQAQRASGIVRQIRQFVQKRPTAMKPLDIDGVIRDVLGLLGPLARRHSVRIEHRPGPGRKLVAGEQIQVGQLFVNLVRNAIDAVAAASCERSVVIETRAGDGNVLVEVRDSGGGVPAEVRARMFEPFFTTKADGLGMGLPISRTIAETHGGRLDLLDRGAGAAFRVTFPAARGRQDEPGGDHAGGDAERVMAS